MKNIYYTFLLLFCLNIYGQIGINTETPIATLDVKGAPNDENSVDGIIAPRLTLDELIAKMNMYTLDQVDVMVYITDVNTNQPIETDPDLRPVKFISLPGYYFFDGDIWKSLEPKTGAVIFVASIGTSQTVLGEISDTYNKIELNQITNIGGESNAWANNEYTIPLSGTYIINGSIRRNDEKNNYYVARDMYVLIGMATEVGDEGIWVSNINAERFVIPYTRISYFEKGSKISFYASSTVPYNFRNAYLSIMLLNQIEN